MLLPANSARCSVGRRAERNEAIHNEATKFRFLGSERSFLGLLRNHWRGVGSGLDPIFARWSGQHHSGGDLRYGSAQHRRAIDHKKPFAFPVGGAFLALRLFCTLSYCLLIVALGLFFGAAPNGSVFRPFSVSGTAWQSLQNVTTYALIAALVHVRTLSDLQLAGRQEAIATQYSAADLNSESKAETAPDAGVSRYFIKIGEELRPLRH